MKLTPLFMTLTPLLTAALSIASASSFAGAVFTATNSPDKNEIVVFSRSAEGMLKKIKTVSTGGKGTGGQLDPLASQGSLKLTADSKWLLAVNAGSDEISLFEVKSDGLKLVQKICSEGKMPVSLAIRGNRVYVLNAGAIPNVAGFELGSHGLKLLKHSIRAVEGASSGALAQIDFGAYGTSLIITDKMQNAIHSFGLNDSGLPSEHTMKIASDGMVPFGFVTDSNGHVLVVNAGSGTVASYAVKRQGEVSAIASSASNGQKAACWIAQTDAGYVFTTNPGSSTLSSFYANAQTGAVTLVQGAAAMGKTPLDLEVVENRFIYAVDPMAGGIDVFKIGYGGALESVTVAPAGISIFAQGLAAY